MAKRGERTRTALLDATLAVVAEHGYAHATTRAIAERAGVAEGTIYRHFPDKVSLFVAATTHGNDDLDAWLDDFPNRAGTSTIAANVTDCLERLATLRDRALPLELAMLMDPELATARARRLAATPGSDILPQLGAYLEREQALGRIRDIDVARTCLILLGVVFTSVVMPPGPHSPTIRDTVELIVNGLTT